MDFGPAHPGFLAEIVSFLATLAPVFSRERYQLTKLLGIDL